MDYKHRRLLGRVDGLEVQVEVDLIPSDQDMRAVAPRALLRHRHIEVISRMPQSSDFVREPQVYVEGEEIQNRSLQSRIRFG